MRCIILLLSSLAVAQAAFLSETHCSPSLSLLRLSAAQDDNKAMAFLRKIGKVGGTTDFSNAMGVDEGSAGKAPGDFSKTKVIPKAMGAYKSCVASGVIDDLTEEFPLTCSGTQWSGITDTVMGGHSSGTLSRESEFGGRPANVLRAMVKLLDNQKDAGFVQMATDLALDPSKGMQVDASDYDGVELEVYYDGQDDKEQFNLHLKNAACQRQFSSYRATFELAPNQWTKIRLPWSQFGGFGWGAVETNFDPSSLRRLGVVAIGKPMEVTLALSRIGFYKSGNVTA